MNLLATALSNGNPANIQMYADLPQFNINGATIPVNSIATSSRPDLVIVNQRQRSIHLLELRCCYDTNHEKSCELKTARYTMLKGDLEDEGWNVSLNTFEVGSIGIITKTNNEKLKNIAKGNNIKSDLKHLILDISKVALISSSSIYPARQDPSWTDPPSLLS